MISFSRFTVLALLACAAAGPAFAQAGPGMPGSSESTPTPQPRVPDIAPAGVPGAGAAPVATGPSMPKPTAGDPTTALFAAINGGDYNAAQDAVGRGANIGAQNDLGETPLDLAIALNRTQITFLLLSTRNEMGGTDTSGGPPPPPQKPMKPTRVSTPPVMLKAPVMGNSPGTPNANAGFLGFNK
jgi:hypothetical protein